MKERKNWDSHVYLYAKRWYQRGDLIEDMKVIIGERAGIDPRYISIADIVFVLSGLVWKAISTQGNSEYFFSEFVLDLLPENYWRINGSKNDTINLVLIRKMLSILSNVRIIDPATGEVFIELDEPDPTILPLSSSHKE